MDSESKTREESSTFEKIFAWCLVIAFVGALVGVFSIPFFSIYKTNARNNIIQAREADESYNLAGIIMSKTYTPGKCIITAETREGIMIFVMEHSTNASVYNAMMGEGDIITFNSASYDNVADGIIYLKRASHI